MYWISLWKNRWLRRLVWGVLAVCALVVLAWQAGPSLIRHQLETRGTEALGRKVTVGAVEFKPWSLELSLSGVQVAGADGQSVQLGVERIYVDVAWQSLWHRAPVVDAIRIDAPHLQAKRARDGAFDWDDIVKRLAARPPNPDNSLPRFALYNLEVNNGSVDMEDQTQGQTYTHQVRKLHLAVPFVSSLGHHLQEVVQPRLAFELDGTVFDTAAQTTPFASDRKSEVTLNAKQLDLKPWLHYVPDTLPVAVKSGVLDVALRLAFTQADKPRISLSGTVTVSNLEVNRRDGTPVLSAGAVQTVLKDVQPLGQLALLESVEVSGLRLHTVRDRDGQLNLDFGSGQPAKSAPAAQPARPWHLGLERFALRDGTVYWTDQTTQTPVRWVLNHWDMTVKDIQWPRVASAAPAGAAQAGTQARPPMLVDGSAKLSEVGADRQPASIAIKGQGDPSTGKADITLANLGLGMFSPWVQQYLVPRADGTVAAQVAASWDSGGVKLTVPRIVLEKFALTGAQARSPIRLQSPATQVDTGTGTGNDKDSLAVHTRDLPSVETLEITGTTVDLGARTASVGKVAVHKASARVVREQGGAWMYERWLRPAATQYAAPPVAQSPNRAAARPASAAPPWAVTVAEVSLDDSTLVWVDHVPARRVFVELSALRLQALSLSPDGTRPVPVQMSARVRSGRTDPGSLNFAGTAMWAPLQVQGALDAKQLPLHVAQPYFADRFNIELARAGANFKGQVGYTASAAGPLVQVKGDASVDDLRASSVLAVQKGSSEPTTEELLDWKSLAMPGLELSMAPGQQLRLKVREVALSDFFARLIIDAEGHLVLQDLVKPGDTGPPASAAPAQGGQGANGATAKAPEPIIDVGPITVINGRVAFSDRFVKPNYSADLTALNGRLSGFRSQAPDGSVQMADLELRGRAEGTAGLEIVGKVNPLAKPLALDIRGKVRDLELSPLSSYAIKYAGYGIERGKLSMDVNYSVKPDGELTATNNIVLSQLTFGDKVEGAPTSLPVKLVATLLADSKGVINLNLPINGSLKDPEFKMWPIVWKIVGNIFAKAITSPFSLFSGAGEEEDLARVAFIPGTTTLTPDAMAGLDKALKVLVDKPSLKTTIVGTASLEAERDAIKRAELGSMMLAEKRRMAGSAGKDVAAVNSVADAEVPDLTKEVYRRADLKKPRNVVGLAKDLSVQDMQALLLDNILVNEETIRTLARNRSVTVREYLTARQLPSERIFLGNEEIAPTAPDWRPQAELSVILD